jgi:hypothetical protein
MDRVEVVVLCAIKGTAMLRLGNCRIGPKRGRESSSINLFAIADNLQEVLVISELPTAHDVMQFLG